MDAKQYTNTLKNLGLTAYSAAPLLGISVRQSHRYASGEQKVKKTVALLLAMFARYGTDNPNTFAALSRARPRARP